MKKPVLIVLFLTLIFVGLYLFLTENNERGKGNDEKLLRSHYAGVDCSKLFGNTIRPNNDVVETRKSVCAAERAWFENDSDFFVSYDDPDHCYGWMTIKTGDLNLCRSKNKKTGYFWIEDKLIDGEKSNSWLYDCYRATANWRNDLSICGQIPYKSSDLLQECKSTSSGWNNHYSKYSDFSPI